MGAACAEAGGLPWAAGAACAEAGGTPWAVEKNKEELRTPLYCVPLSILFSNSFLRDLDLIWELRTWIPDPTKPIVPPNHIKII